MRVTFSMKSWRVSAKRYFSAFWKLRQICDLADVSNKILVGQITDLAILYLKHKRY
jgi:hypothetical protein